MHVRPGRLTILECHFNKTTHRQQSKKSSLCPTTGLGVLTTMCTEPKTEMSNILSHIKNLEQNNMDLKAKLDDALQCNGKLSQKTREGMPSVLDTLMKWMDTVDTKEPKVKDDFKVGLEKLVQNSAEDNSVWQMMVSASALHERQEHDLEKLRVENTDLRKRVDGIYTAPESRILKRLATEQLSREDVPRGR